ncbi:Lsr2 family protein [Nocardia rhizosphaerihabitans]|uniref:histone-like nucleoid-structuring protein Lsr2 n=1 Tax=Nocardia rhizosphaerihabitans TaxID=1691570 RepID=UPI0036717EDD
MARKVVVTLVDDFDGTSRADETVTFAIDGAAYDIDLSEANATTLREWFQQWIPHARRTGSIKSLNGRKSLTRTPATGSRRSNDLTAVRAWATENGYAVSARGRIAAEIITAYEKASA